MADSPTTHIEMTEAQRGIILSALTEKLLDVKRYISGSKVPEVPGPEDTCCEAHVERHRIRRENYVALKRQLTAVNATIELFEHAPTASPQSTPDAAFVAHHHPELTDDQVGRAAAALAHSSVLESLGDVVFAIVSDQTHHTEISEHSDKDAS